MTLISGLSNIGNSGYDPNALPDDDDGELGFDMNDINRVFTGLQQAGRVAAPFLSPAGQAKLNPLLAIGQRQLPAAGSPIAAYMPQQQMSSAAANPALLAMLARAGAAGSPAAMLPATIAQTTAAQIAIDQAKDAQRAAMKKVAEKIDENSKLKKGIKLWKFGTFSTVSLLAIAGAIIGGVYVAYKWGQSAAAKNAAAAHSASGGGSPAPAPKSEPAGEKK